ncbi:hypothetical protein LSH36_140g05051 [Paralvinella palmiformis]|uniref:Uncharacterized protein n=1 Tax=Paralvinella palmiformis TaxID=53620 RepID=A0AAD9JVB7_9ANNE|nr:hypothetical protein LSH36_140g05051 [Paralvinella palmiformis]
MELERHFRGKV